MYISISIYAYMDAYMYIHIYIYTYTHIHNTQIYIHISNLLCFVIVLFRVQTGRIGLPRIPAGASRPSPRHTSATTTRGG